MSHCTGELERRHEGDALSDAGRQVAGTQLIESAPGAASLVLVPLAFANARQDQAARVVERTSAE